jgi:uncharacterized protein (UPF0128 family)
MASIGLYAGIPMAIEKDSKTQKEYQLSVTHKDSPKDQSKMSITVTFKGDKFTKVHLVSGGKNVDLTTEIKDGMVSMSFEIEKAQLENSSLQIGSSDPIYEAANCAPGFIMYLKEFIV